jgi:hypothetical protein
MRDSIMSYLSWVNYLGVVCGSGVDLIHSPHLLVRATSERRVSALVATNGSHWLK